VDSPRALVDLARAELVVDEPLDTDDRALPLVVSGAARRRIEPTVEPGRYPIERWVFLSQLAQWGDLSRATATRVGVLDVVDGITRLDEGVIRTMAALFTKVRATSMFPTYPGAVVDALVGRGRARDHDTGRACAHRGCRAGGNPDRPARRSRLRGVHRPAAVARRGRGAQV